KKRKDSELEQQERRILDASLALAVAFRRQHEAQVPLDPISARSLRTEALEPLHGALLAHDCVVANDPVTWPIGARRRLKASISRLENLTAFCHKLSASNPHMTTGVVGAVIAQLLAEDLPEFNADEQNVLDAIRRSN